MGGFRGSSMRLLRSVGWASLLVAIFECTTRHAGISSETWMHRDHCFCGKLKALSLVNGVERPNEHSVNTDVGHTANSEGGCGRCSGRGHHHYAGTHDYEPHCNGNPA